MSYIYKFYDDKDREWRVYYDETKSALSKFASAFGMNRYTNIDNGEYEITDCEVTLYSLSRKKKRKLELTANEAMKYIGNYLNDPELEEF